MNRGFQERIHTVVTQTLEQFFVDRSSVTGKCFASGFPSRCIRAIREEIGKNNVRLSEEFIGLCMYVMVTAVDQIKGEHTVVHEMDDPFWDITREANTPIDREFEMRYHTDDGRKITEYFENDETILEALGCHLDLPVVGPQRRRRECIGLPMEDEFTWWKMAQSPWGGELVRRFVSISGFIWHFLEFSLFANGARETDCWVSSGVVSAANPFPDPRSRQEVITRMQRTLSRAWGWTCGGAFNRRTMAIATAIIVNRRETTDAQIETEEGVWEALLHHCPGISNLPNFDDTKSRRDEYPYIVGCVITGWDFPKEAIVQMLLGEDTLTKCADARA